MENKSLVNGLQMALDGLNATVKADGANNCALRSTIISISH